VLLLRRPGIVPALWATLARVRRAARQRPLLPRRRLGALL